MLYVIVLRCHDKTIQSVAQTCSSFGLGSKAGGRTEAFTAENAEESLSASARPRVSPPLRSRALPGA